MNRTVAMALALGLASGLMSKASFAVGLEQKGKPESAVGALTTYGLDVPSRTALKSVIPSGWQLFVHKSAKLPTSMSWEKGESWPRVLGGMAEGAQLSVLVDWSSRTVLIRTQDVAVQEQTTRAEIDQAAVTPLPRFANAKIVKPAEDIKAAVPAAAVVLAVPATAVVLAVVPVPPAIVQTTSAPKLVETDKLSVLSAPAVIVVTPIAAELPKYSVVTTNKVPVITPPVPVEVVLVAKAVPIAERVVVLASQLPVMVKPEEMLPLPLVEAPAAPQHIAVIPVSPVFTPQPLAEVAVVQLPETIEQKVVVQVFEAPKVPQSAMEAMAAIPSQTVSSINVVPQVERISSSIPVDEDINQGRASILMAAMEVAADAGQPVRNIPQVAVVAVKQARQVLAPVVVVVKPAPSLFVKPAVSPQTAPKPLVAPVIVVMQAPERIEPEQVYAAPVVMPVLRSNPTVEMVATQKAAAVLKPAVLMSTADFSYSAAVALNKPAVRTVVQGIANKYGMQLDWSAPDIQLRGPVTLLAQTAEEDLNLLRKALGRGGPILFEISPQTNTLRAYASDPSFIYVKPVVVVVVVKPEVAAQEAAQAIEIVARAKAGVAPPQFTVTIKANEPLENAIHRLIKAQGYTYDWNVAGGFEANREMYFEADTLIGVLAQILPPLGISADLYTQEKHIVIRPGEARDL